MNRNTVLTLTYIPYPCVFPASIAAMDGKFMTMKDAKYEMVAVLTTSSVVLKEDAITVLTAAKDVMIDAVAMLAKKKIIRLTQRQ